MKCALKIAAGFLLVACLLSVTGCQEKPENKPLSYEGVAIDD